MVEKFKDLIGKRFGCLVAIKHSLIKKPGGALWECICDCGKTSLVRSQYLIDGRTRSCGCRSFRKSMKERFFSKIIKKEDYECWGWRGALCNGGYGCFTMNKRVKPAHRASWEIHNGPIPKGLWVLHKCDNKICSNPDHLFLGNAKENVHDMISKGRNIRGELSCHAKLTSNDIINIRKEYLNKNATYLEISRKYYVNASHIGRIIRKERWNNIEAKKAQSVGYEMTPIENIEEVDE